MSIDSDLERLRDLQGEMLGSLEFYEKFVHTTNPKHKGIPYMAATEGFSSNELYAYGKFWRLFKRVCQQTGLTSLWDSATGWGGWIYNHRRAMGTLFPKGSQETKIVNGQPTLVPQKIVKDPDRAKAALPYLTKMMELIDRDLVNLETTIKSEPETFTHAEDDLMEAVMLRIGRRG